MSKVPSDFGEWKEPAKLHFTKIMRSSSKEIGKFGKN